MHWELWNPRPTPLCLRFWETPIRKGFSGKFAPRITYKFLAIKLSVYNWMNCGAYIIFISSACYERILKHIMKIEPTRKICESFFRYFLLLPVVLCSLSKAKNTEKTHSNCFASLAFLSMLICTQNPDWIHRNKIFCIEFDYWLPRVLRSCAKIE